MVVTFESLTQDRMQRQTVLIATDNRHESNYIAEALEEQGYAVRFCEYDGVTLKGTPVKPPNAVLCVFSDYIERLPHIIKSLKAHFHNKEVLFIGALMRAGNIGPELFDSLIFPPAHVKQIANRVSSMIRLEQMEREIQRRVETVREDFGINYELSEAAFSKPFRILFVGKATPSFMVVINALQTKNVEVVAAFTSFSAFDYLHEHRFDAVVMNALRQSEPALTISETMRRNARLYHVPTLFLIDEAKFQDYDLAYQKGARDIISTSAETKEVSGRILELANYHRIHDQLKTEFGMIGGLECTDADSGVFNAEFFSAHMRRVSQSLKKSGEPLAIIAVKACPDAKFHVEKDKISQAYSKVGQMLKSLVRMQDIIARIADDTYLIAFPEQDSSTVKGVVERISGIVDCAAFESGHLDKGPFAISVETAIMDVGQDDNHEDVIKAAISAVLKEPVIPSERPRVAS